MILASAAVSGVALSLQHRSGTREALRMQPEFKNAIERTFGRQGSAGRRRADAGAEQA